MGTRLILLKMIGKAVLHASGVGGLWTLLVEDLPDLANEVWSEWSASRSADERRADLEDLAVSDEGIDLEVNALLAEIAADQPEEIRADLTTYLTQIPVSVRQTLRRPSDPTGRTVPSALEPRSGRDMIPFLDAQRALFKAGDRPIPGVDWELVELLGIGGFGEVWKARHVLLDDVEPVALKFCTDPEARERLLKHEAKLCARVMKQGRHPGIVHLRHAYLTADPPCLEYEFIEGGTLAGQIKDWERREPRPSIEELTHHLLAIAEVVAFMHRLDPPIVHRDLKPANILVQGTNGSTRFKITDFGIGGIATAAVIRATRQSTRPSLLLTRAASGSHTPLYASPEQAAGSQPDPRDDVHALGVIWFQMLTGNLADGRPSGAKWKQRLSERGVPEEWIGLLESCFEAAADRPADASALIERLRGGFSHITPNHVESEGAATLDIPITAHDAATAADGLSLGSQINVTGYPPLKEELLAAEIEYQRQLQLLKQVEAGIHPVLTAGRQRLAGLQRDFHALSKHHEGQLPQAAPGVLKSIAEAVAKDPNVSLSTLGEISGAPGQEDLFGYVQSVRRLLTAEKDLEIAQRQGFNDRQTLAEKLNKQVEETFARLVHMREIDFGEACRSLFDRTSREYTLFPTETWINELRNIRLRRYHWSDQELLNKAERQWENWMDDFAFKKAHAISGIEGLEKYLAAFPSGHHQDDAKSMIEFRTEQELWKKVESRKDRPSFREYLARVKTSPRTKFVEQQLQDSENRSRRANAISSGIASSISQGILGLLIGAIIGIGPLVMTVWAIYFAASDD